MCFPELKNGNVSNVKFDQSLSHIQAWCSTAVDGEGVFINGFWGYCGPGCPIEDDVDVSECADSLTHHYDDTDTPK